MAVIEVSYNELKPSGPLHGMDIFAVLGCVVGSQNRLWRRLGRFVLVNLHAQARQI